MAITLEGLRAIDDNARAIDDVVGRRNQVCPFIGAGLSVAAGLPTWTQFLLGQVITLPSAERARVEEAISKHAYEDAAQRMLDTLPPNAVQERLFELFGGEGRAYAPLPAAILALASSFSGPILTTNYDGVIEHAFKKAGRSLHCTIGFQHDGFLRGIESGEPWLMKIHGDGGERTHRVLAVAEYDRAYGKRDAEMGYDGPVARVLSRLFIIRSLLFVGCSLYLDRTLEVFERAYAASLPVPSHFAVLQRPDDEEERTARKHFLECRGIRPIWYPKGQHDAVTVLFDALFPKNAARKPSSHTLGQSSRTIDELVRDLVSDDPRVAFPAAADMATCSVSAVDILRRTSQQRPRSIGRIARRRLFATLGDAGAAVRAAISSADRDWFAADEAVSCMGRELFPQLEHWLSETAVQRVPEVSRMAIAAIGYGGHAGWAGWLTDVLDANDRYIYQKRLSFVSRSLAQLAILEPNALQHCHAAACLRTVSALPEYSPDGMLVTHLGQGSPALGEHLVKWVSDPDAQSPDVLLWALAEIGLVRTTRELIALIDAGTRGYDAASAVARIGGDRALEYFREREGQYPDLVPLWLIHADDATVEREIGPVLARASAGTRWSAILVCGRRRVAGHEAILRQLQQEGSEAERGHASLALARLATARADETARALHAATDPVEKLHHALALATIDASRMSVVQPVIVASLPHSLRLERSARINVCEALQAIPHPDAVSLAEAWAPLLGLVGVSRELYLD